MQELAFTFANAIAYAQAALDRGMDFDSFAPRLSFFFNTHNDFLEEIAKFRAARRIWAKIAKETIRRAESSFDDAALSRADGRLHADGPAAGQQYRAGRASGAGRRSRRCAVAAHELQG